MSASLSSTQTGLINRALIHQGERRLISPVLAGKSPYGSAADAQADSRTAYRPGRLPQGLYCRGRAGQRCKRQCADDRIPYDHANDSKGIKKSFSFYRIRMNC
jgi:hypothetical protein